MIQALMTQCLVALLRRLCQSGRCGLSWLSALDDPRLARALKALLDQPARPLTLASLARIAGMSRSGFSERFTQAFGRSPMELRREMRLHRAAQLLRTTSLPIKDVARRVGFGSRSHFSRAFQNLFGVDPVRFRSAAPER
jgi:transcriptional regulator GlxA family with amidase domain